MNQDITVRVMMQLPSGGHDHINQPPGNLLGELHEVHSGIIGIPEITAPTNADGTIEIIYTAPEFSGIFNITAEVTYLNQDLESMDVLTVRVPGLVDLGPSNDCYELVGAPTNHSGTNDPCRPESPTSQHYHNHYGTEDLNNAIVNIAVSYYSQHPGVRLRINDMSLEYGGLFDLNNNWDTPHNTHRVGRNADIGLNRINLNNECIPINKIHINQIIDDYFNSRIIEGDHYHISIN